MAAPRPDATHVARADGRGSLLVVWVASAAVLGLFVAADWARNRVLAPPLDDTFIHFQYAKQLARGHFFEYQDGEGVSTGATSFLYPVLLAPFWLAGLRGLRLIWAAHLLNLLGLALAATSVLLGLRRLGTDRRVALAGSLLVVFNGWLAWGVASGMAIGVTAGLLGWTLLEAVRFLQGRGAKRLGAAVALLSMARPEGLVISWCLVAGLVAARALSLWPPRGQIRGLGSRLNWAWIALKSGLHHVGAPMWLGLVAGLVPTLLLAALSGHLTTNGMLVKAHAAHDMSWVRYVWETGRTIAAVPGRLLWSPAPFGTALLCLGVVGAWAGLAWRAGARDEDVADPLVRAWARGTLWATVFAALGIVGFYGFLIEHVEHHNRYYMPYVPFTVLLASYGLWDLGRRIAGRFARPFSLAALGVLLVMGVGSVGEWARIYAKNCTDIARTYLPMARWMREHLPPDAKVAVHDAGALFYLSGRRCYDMLGLVTNEFRPPGGARVPGFIWETLERIHPGYMVIYPNYLPRVARLPILRKLHGERLAEVTIAGGREKTAYEIQWDRILDANRTWSPSPRGNFVLADSLDHVDRRSERHHGYALSRGHYRIPDSYRLAIFRRQGKFLLDGARVHTGPESFRLSGIQPGRDGLFVIRVAAAPAGPVLVSVNGTPVSDWVITPDPQTGEAHLRIPASALRTRRVRVRLDPHGRELAVCHAFLFQSQ